MVPPNPIALPRLRPHSPSAFTLVELMVVILIIAVLMAILIPTVASVRRASYGAKTQSTLSQLAAAIEAYHTDYRAYPGPVPNNQIGVVNASGIMRSNNVTTGIDDTYGVTMAENLYLGLSGGIGLNPANVLVFDVTGAALGKGPHTLATSGPNVNRLHAAYVEGLTSSWDLPRPLSSPQGQFQDNLDTARDTIIPEYVDGYSQPLPILYLRASSSAHAFPAAAGGITMNNNEVITPDGYNRDSSNTVLGPAQYGLRQITGYTSTGIGEGKDTSRKSMYYTGGAADPTKWPAHGLRAINITYTTVVGSGNFTYPYESYSYFGNPSFLTGTTFSQPRQKDGFILISAGPDRIYGTEDDICNFGSLSFAK